MMMSRHVSVIVLLGCLLLPAWSSAQASSEGADERIQLQGFQMQGRAKMGSILSSLQPSPGLVLGYRADRLSIGLGGNWTRFQASQTITTSAGSSSQGTTTRERQDVTLRGSLVQVLPFFKYDLFVSEEGRTHFGPFAAVGYGVVNSKAEGDSTSQTPLTASFIPVRAGVNGEYFFSSHFGVGVEGGLQFSFVTNVESFGEEVDISFGSNTIYGAINAIFVL